MSDENMLKDELEFCKSSYMEKNDHGQYIYESTNRKSVLNLPYILKEYKDWIEGNLSRKKEPKK